jgi:hypothetical protein
VIRLGNHFLALLSTYSESMPIRDHQWLKTLLFGHSVAAAPRWAIRGQLGLESIYPIGSSDSLVTTSHREEGLITELVSVICAPNR